MTARRVDNEKAGRQLPCQPGDASRQHRPTSPQAPRRAALVRRRPDGGSGRKAGRRPAQISQQHSPEHSTNRPPPPWGVRAKIMQRRRKDLAVERSVEPGGPDSPRRPSRPAPNLARPSSLSMLRAAPYQSGSVSLQSPVQSRLPCQDAHETVVAPVWVIATPLHTECPRTRLVFVHPASSFTIGVQ